jgi:hypothetical protein
MFEFLNQFLSDALRFEIAHKFLSLKGYSKSILLNILRFYDDGECGVCTPVHDRESTILGSRMIMEIITINY